MRRIARSANGSIVWYESFLETEDSTWDYHHYYDGGRRLRFVLINVNAANGTRQRHRAYFDVGGKLIWQARKTLAGPGYFGPQNVAELVKQDPEKEFVNDEGCKEIKPEARRRKSKS